MAIVTRVEPIDQDIAVFTSELLSPQARSTALANVAREKLAEGEQKNQTILGRIPPHKTFVDGTQGQSEEQVRPEGTILYEFELLGDIFKFIADQLQQHAPVLTGQYQKSFEFFADWQQVDVGGVIPANAAEYIFLNTVPYAKKIEGDASRPPQSKQAPDGVFQVVAQLARARFGNQARIEFVYRSPEGRALLKGAPGNRSDARAPAISIKLK